MMKAVFAEPCDFCATPSGGQVHFARLFVRNVMADWYLFGFSAREKLFSEIKVAGRLISFRALDRSSIYDRKRFVPLRIRAFVRLLPSIPALNRIKADVIFVQAPEFLIPLALFCRSPIVFCVPGSAVALEGARYRWARYFGRLQRRVLVWAGRRCAAVLVSADSVSVNWWRTELPGTPVRQFPTVFDSQVFQPSAQPRLGTRGAPLTLITVGRVSRGKGWQLILDTVVLLRSTGTTATITFVGDGEDISQVRTYASKCGLVDACRITGRISQAEVAREIQASDVVLIASESEGWSLAMTEALGCGAVLVSTDVSGARDMIIEGVNGYVLTRRNPTEMARLIRAAALLLRPNDMSLDLAVNFRDDRLPFRLREALEETAVGSLIEQ